MTILIVSKQKQDSRRARNLESGDQVRSRVVQRVELMDGNNGEEPLYIGGGGEKTALALRIHFREGPSAIVHPNDKADV